jgi:hypothetical protein
MYHGILFKYISAGNGGKSTSAILDISIHSLQVETHRPKQLLNKLLAHLTGKHKQEGQHHTMNNNASLGGSTEAVITGKSHPLPDLVGESKRLTGEQKNCQHDGVDNACHGNHCRLFLHIL